MVVARDAAGNETVAGWPLVVKDRQQPMASVTLTRSFFDNVLPRLAGGASADPAASFDDVNTRVRAENEARIRELLAESSSQPLFDGALQQLANSQVTSRFAEQRTYFVDGAAVSKAMHYGYDLASHGGRADHRGGGGARALRGRARHLRQLRADRPRHGARDALRPPLEHRRRGGRSR